MKRKKFIWMTTTFYDILCKYSDTEDDKFIQQSIWSYIGWINCIQAYNITPSKNDLKECKRYYKKITGKKAKI